MYTCPKCGSHKTNTYRHLHAKVWCTECGFVLRNEGSDVLNTYHKEEELKEGHYNPDDMNLLLLTEEHLQKVIREVMVDVIEEYFSKEGFDRLLKDIYPDKRNTNAKTS